MTDLLQTIDQPHAQLLLRLTVGAVLLLAGVTKLADRAAFRDAIAAYDVLPAAPARVFAAALPWAEAGLGTLLLLGLATTAAAALATAVFLSFTIAIGVNLARGRDLDCHCFGAVQSERVGWPTLLRAASLALAALAVASATSRFGSLELALFGSSESLPSASDVIPVVFLAFVILDVLVLLPEALAFRAAFDTMQRARATGANHGHVHSRHAPADGARSAT